MPENSDNVFDLYHVKGETISLFVPLGCTLIGIISSIFIAHSLLFTDLNTGRLLSWSPKTSNQPGQEAEKPVIDEINAADLTATTGDHDKTPVESDENASRNISTSVSDSSEPQFSNHSGDIASLQKVELISEVAEETINSPDIKSDSLLPPKRGCPVLFFFTFPKSSETPDFHTLIPQIKRLDSWLGQHPYKKVIIEGHADASGSEEYNLLLSYRRAKAAEKILIEAGISKKQLLTRAFGEQAPLQGQSALSGKNRRASIRVEALQECINSLINGNSN